MLGAALGSFLNMLVWRLDKGESLLGRSYCDHSKKPLKPIDLIPIFSFFIFRGKCRECGKKIPLLYPFIEFLGGILTSSAFIVSWNSYGSSLSLSTIFIATSILSSFLMIELFFGYFDFLYWQVEARSVYIVLGYLILLVIVNFFIPLPFFNDSTDHLLGGVFLASIIGLVFILSNKGGMGDGDIFLFGITGLMLGLKGGLIAFMITVFSGAIFGMIKAVKVGKLKKTKIQLAPFIALGTIIALLFQQEILNLYL
jgi:leader peptidase (prepilin peptidase)/N-methyltransferase